MLTSALWGCTTLSPDLRAAATVQGRASAGISIPAQMPAECRTAIPHALIRVGDQAVSALARERGQLDKANGKQAVCAHWYGKLAAGLGK